MKFDLAVVVPTLNEVGNVEPLYEKLCATLEGIAWEVIYVDDDSKDGTLDVLAALQTKHANVRYIRRVGRRGLASASIEGMMASSAPYLAVMDADLQHDETLLPQMLSVVRDDGYDIVSASRFLEGSKLEGLSKMRTRMSQVGIGMVNWLLRAKLTDPLTGFFLLRRDVLNEVVYDLSQQGFKILVDIFASAKRPLKAKEVPMTFRERHSGASKLDLMVLFEFLTLLSDKTIGAVIPTRFIMFVLVGLTGVGVHVGVLGLVHKVMALDFWLGQSAAVIVAMSTNFYLNNVF
ncbi:MAG: polyprenol monophosphomannose synthase, partial [Rhodospirillaceae bacterium]